MNGIHTAFAEVARFTGFSLLRILPFLLVSVPLTVLLKRSGASERIKATLNKGPILAVVLATVFGAVSPLCSCGVIPVVAALLAGGVPLAPVMAFWLASPSMDPEILALSAGTLGWPMALWRLVSTFAMSLGGGLAILVLEKRGSFTGGILKAAGQSHATAAGVSAPAFTRLAQSQAPLSLAMAPATCGCETGPSGKALTRIAKLPAEAASARGSRSVLKALARESLDTLVRLGGYMSLAFALEAVIMRYLPAEMVAGVLGGNHPWSIPLAAFLGVPLYATNLSALGVVSGLMARGMDAGASLAFMVGGAVTTIPAMAAVAGVVKRKVFVLYLGLAFAGALFAGYSWKLAQLFL